MCYLAFQQVEVYHIEIMELLTKLMNNPSKTSTVQIKRIKPSIIYRLLLIGLGTPMVIYGLVCGVLGMFGYDQVRWNDTVIHGLLALPAGLLAGLSVSVFLTVVIGTIACFGLWLYSLVRPLTIETRD
ncbi:hypothetical protein DXT09_02410 [Escherichia coli]|uniref:Uncharacterized protein n=3 Tax=Escherichia coli TaxID=562 RepID=A0A2A6Q1B5_ECOLX|nr:hypothetical protein ERJG_02691 [Escherichia coli M863]EGE62940.1 hypothetical protein ECSTEC7V_4235 [Escherichia coli STEC_7v]EGO9151302.1 hypothetical protein [Escherichia coli]EGO9479565.1 hypothetical protein [Escherichia coli]OTB59728.1 hypothetical protein AW065_24715 [Escherichia coli]